MGRGNAEVLTFIMCCPKKKTDVCAVTMSSVGDRQGICERKTLPGKLNSGSHCPEICSWIHRRITQ